MTIDFSIWDEYENIYEQIVPPYKTTKNKQEQFLWYLYLRINSLGREVVFLLKNGTCASGQIVVRSMLESFADLQLLVDDPDYVHSMTRADAYSELQYLESYNIKNPFFSGFTPACVKARKEELKQLTASGTGLSIKEKFKKSNNLYAYCGVYRLFNSNVHGNLGSFVNASLGLSSPEYQANETKLIYSNVLGLCVSSAVEISHKIEFASEFKCQLERCLEKVKLS